MNASRARLLGIFSNALQVLSILLGEFIECNRGERFYL
jgi:hypothetical protein